MYLVLDLSETWEVIPIMCPCNWKLKSEYTEKAEGFICLNKY